MAKKLQIQSNGRSDEFQTPKEAIDKIDAFLILKKKQAEILLKYCKIRKENKNYSEKEEELYQQIKKLNKRGTEGIGFQTFQQIMHLSENRNKEIQERKDYEETMKEIGIEVIKC